MDVRFFDEEERKVWSRRKFYNWWDALAAAWTLNLGAWTLKICT